MKVYPFYIAGTVLLFTSCAQVFYVPNVQNIPILEHKGDIQLGGAWEEPKIMKHNSSAIAISTAFAIKDSTFLMFSFIMAPQGESIAGTTRLEVGYGKCLLKETDKLFTSMFIYNGLGIGFNSDTAVHSTLFSPFTQAIIAHKEKLWEAAVSLRV